MEAIYTPKRSKLIRIGVVVLVATLILGAGAVFYFFIYPKLIKSDGEASEETIRYFEGPEYFEEVDGEKRLLVVEGVITKIDEEGIIITMGGEDYDIPRGDIGEITATSLGTEEGEGRVQRTILSYEDLFIGLFISYHPSFGTITVDASALSNE